MGVHVRRRAPSESVTITDLTTAVAPVAMAVASAADDDESKVAHACSEMSRHFLTIMEAHKELTEEPSSNRQAKKTSNLIESLLTSVVKQLMSYEGTRGLASAVVRSSGAVSDAGVQVTPGQFAMQRVSPFAQSNRVPIWERGIEWERRRQQKLAEWRQQKEQQELSLADRPRNMDSRWAHVQSVMKMERLREEEEARQAAEEAQRQAEADAFAEAQRQARALAEQELRAQAERDDAEIEAAIKAEAEEMARRAAEAARRAREEAERKRKEAEADARTVRAAFGHKGLERRGSMPTKLAWRVSSPDLLSGNVMHEYRVKDTLTRTKGVSFVMGQTRDSSDDVVQVVLFDKAEFDEVRAAKWWAEHEHKFKNQIKKAGTALPKLSHTVTQLVDKEAQRRASLPAPGSPAALAGPLAGKNGAGAGAGAPPFGGRPIKMTSGPIRPIGLPPAAPVMGGGPGGASPRLPLGAMGEREGGSRPGSGKLGGAARAMASTVPR